MDVFQSAILWRSTDPWNNIQEVLQRALKVKDAEKSNSGAERTFSFPPCSDILYCNLPHYCLCQEFNLLKLPA